MQALPMRALKTAVVVMGVLIAAGVATVVVTIVQRTAGLSAPPVSQPALLAEPDGTRIASVAVGGDRLALHLQGGGPDRVVLLDARTGQVLLRAGLAR